jgi:DNA-binding phage protein
MSKYTTANMHPEDRRKLAKLRKHVAREKNVTHISDMDVMRRVLEIALKHYDVKGKPRALNRGQ